MSYAPFPGLGPRGSSVGDALYAVAQMRRHVVDLDASLAVAVAELGVETRLPLTSHAAGTPGTGIPALPARYLRVWMWITPCAASLP